MDVVVVGSEFFCVCNGFWCCGGVCLFVIVWF